MHFDLIRLRQLAGAYLPDHAQVVYAIQRWSIEGLILSAEPWESVCLAMVYVQVWLLLGINYILLVEGWRRSSLGRRRVVRLRRRGVASLARHSCRWDQCSRSRKCDVRWFGSTLSEPATVASVLSQRTTHRILRGQHIVPTSHFTWPPASLKMIASMTVTYQRA